MKTNTITISQVERLLENLELKLTNQMNKEIKVRVKEEVYRQIEQKDEDLENEIM